MEPEVGLTGAQAKLLFLVLWAGGMLLVAVGSAIYNKVSLWLYNRRHPDAPDQEGDWMD